MVVTDSQTRGGRRGRGRGAVRESKSPADILAGKRFHYCVSSHFRRFEMHGNGLIAPRVFELVASIGDVNKLHTQLVRDIFKTSRLVTQFRRKEQQSFGWTRHSRCVSLPGSNKAIGARDSIFHQRLRGTDGDQLVPGWLGTAVPGFAEKRNASLRSRR